MENIRLGGGFKDAEFCTVCADRGDFWKGYGATDRQPGKKWGGSRALIVYGGGSVVRSGLLERVEKSLKSKEIVYEEFGGVKPNPRLAFAEEGVKRALAFQADFILAVGRRQCD